MLDYNKGMNTKTQIIQNGMEIEEIFKVLFAEVLHIAAFQFSIELCDQRLRLRKLYVRDTFGENVIVAFRKRK
jgi:hypothetical protein